MTMLRFQNKGVLEIAAAITLGVNVKEGDTPIGHFGTGLKFAIATLLRTGHRVMVWDGSSMWRMVSRPEIIRGAQFEIVWAVSDDKEHRTGFTTQLGRGWELWQAYRELRCNAMDEGDWSISIEEGDRPSPGPAGRTEIWVTGEGIQQVHAERRRYFIEDAPIAEVHGIGTIHAGESRSIFYRGVAVLQLEKMTQFTYNFTEFTALTEDRTMANTWMLPSKIGRMVAGLQNHEWIARCVLSPDSFMESECTFSGATPSSEFMDVMRRNKTNMRANKHARDLWESMNPTDPVYLDVELDEHEQFQLTNAITTVWKMDADCKIGRNHIQVVADLGEGILGLFSNDRERILISRAAFKMGIEMVAGTIYEEWCHQTKGLKDESRELQNHLLNQLVRCAQRMP